MKKVAIIQARMDSSRLPGKVLFRLGDYKVLELVHDRVRKSNIDEIVVATTWNPLDNEIELFCENNSIKCFRGSEDDVLDRVYNCAHKHNADILIEITADCPFVDYRHINEMLGFFDNNDAAFQYVSNCFPRSWADGFDVQIYNYFVLYSLEVLKNNKNNKNINREHVGWNIQNCDENKYSNFKHYPAPQKYRLPHIGLTLDTKEDFELLTQVSQLLIDKKIRLDEVSAIEIIDLLLEKPELSKINEQIKRKIPSGKIPGE